MIVVLIIIKRYEEVIAIYVSMASLDIVELIENNPITRLNRTYNCKLLNKIKDNFTETGQQLFVASFFCFLNYQKNDFVIDLDNIWDVGVRTESVR